MLKAMISALPSLWRGLLVTLEVSLIVVVAALVIGVLLGVAVTYGPKFLRLLVHLFSDIIRGIPILVLIFFVYYGIPFSGLKVNNFAAGVAALVLFSAAQVTEITRGSLQSIHHGQMEAAKAIGITFPQALFYVIFPQAVRRFLPPWINSVADTVKGTALLSLVGIVDLMLAIQQVIGRTYEPMPLYILGALIYFAINYSLSLLSRRIEARFAHFRE